MDGGTSNVRTAAPAVKGLSPRGRGNPPLASVTVTETVVYPRVDGGTFDSEGCKL